MPSILKRSPGFVGMTARPRLFRLVQPFERGPGTSPIRSPTKLFVVYFAGIRYTIYNGMQENGTEDNGTETTGSCLILGMNGTAGCSSRQYIASCGSSCSDCSASACSRSCRCVRICWYLWPVGLRYYGQSVGGSAEPDRHCWFDLILLRFRVLALGFGGFLIALGIRVLNIPSTAFCLSFDIARMHYLWNLL
jgi:hypothetical protein